MKVEIIKMIRSNNKMLNNYDRMNRRPKVENKVVANYGRIYKKITTPNVRSSIPDDRVRFCMVKQYLLSRNNYSNINVRAGIIPYTMYDGKLYFGFGVDTTYGDLTDFGGGVQKSDKNPINGAIREFREESLGVFDPICDEDIYTKYMIYTDKILTILVYYDVNPKCIIDNFRQKVSSIEKPEVKDIIWLSKEDLLNSVLGKGSRIYYRVRHLLKYSLNLWTEI